MQSAMRTGIKRNFPGDVLSAPCGCTLSPLTSSLLFPSLLCLFGHTPAVVVRLGSSQSRTMPPSIPFPIPPIIALYLSLFVSSSPCFCIFYLTSLYFIFRAINWQHAKAIKQQRAARRHICNLRVSSGVDGREGEGTRLPQIPSGNSPTTC